MRRFYFRWKVKEITKSYIYHSHFYVLFTHYITNILYLQTVCIYKIRSHTLKCNSLLVPTSHILVHCYNKLRCIARERQHRHKISLTRSPSDESNTHLPVTNSQIHYFLWEIYIHILLHLNLIASCFVWWRSDYLKIIEFHEAIKCVTPVSSSTFPTFGTKEMPHNLKRPYELLY
jgi:hypothetical protein